MADDFTAATWNVYHGTSMETLRPILKGLRNKGVSLFLIQEGQNPGLRMLLAKHGLVAVRGGFECIVAYDPEVWELRKARVVRLSPTTYFRKSGRAVPFMESPLVVLEHRATGKRIKALSYHTPSAVQRGGRPNRKVKARLRVTENAMRLFKRLSGRSRKALLFGGDDNWDERHGRWPVMSRRFTGLRVVQAPDATHGKRRIDDFRIKGLKLGRSKWTERGGGDHRVHVRSFNF